MANNTHIHSSNLSAVDFTQFEPTTFTRELMDTTIARMIKSGASDAEVQQATRRMEATLQNQSNPSADSL